MAKKFLLILIAFCSCATQKKLNNTTSHNNGLTVGGRLFTSVFQQHAAEYKALCFQAYNIATLRLHQAIDQSTSSRPKAVITDIDETILDNSPYAVHRALLGLDYEPTSWMDWTSQGVADTLSGALRFFKYAASKNVEVFYVSNRSEKERAGTIANLKKFGFPYADDAHLILKTTVSSKEPRRQQLAASYNIILLIGDNLADFSGLFDHKTTTERTQNVRHLADDFGKKFIVLPNANYGDWESALYQYNYRLTSTQKDSIIKSLLRGY
ncbi:MAG: 5'-nucleotidase, lipoprotein e(P4) family [Bacteroidetes bacterium]|nr:5'-nucleotidase, lipoprotein e(P4) family [Bacteroidota bacterium]MBS1540692.1 5'-nucleotidase, lipoprotein e(P4) family [Bacteroidota bacterium]